MVLDCVEFDLAALLKSNPPYDTKQRTWTGEQARTSITLTDEAMYGAMGLASLRHGATARDRHLEALAAWLRYGRQVVPLRKNIRVRINSHDRFKDAERTAWSARIGDAMGLLYLESIPQFHAFAHLEDLLSQRVRRPDFVCVRQTPSGWIMAYAECKGSIRTGKNRIHQYIKDAEPQLQGTGGYALATFLQDQQEQEPSVLAVARVGTSEVPVSPEQASKILRVHFANVVSLIGFTGLAHWLVSPSGRIGRPRTRSTTVGRRRFVAPISQISYPFQLSLDEQVFEVLVRHPLRESFVDELGECLWEIGAMVGRQNEHAAPQGQYLFRSGLLVRYLAASDFTDPVIRGR